MIFSTNPKISYFKVNISVHFHVEQMEVNLTVEENVEVENILRFWGNIICLNIPFAILAHLYCIKYQVQNSDNFTLNEGASLAEEEENQRTEEAEQEEVEQQEEAAKMAKMDEVDKVAMVVPMEAGGVVEKKY